MPRLRNQSIVNGACALFAVASVGALSAGCEEDGTFTVVRPELFAEPEPGTTIVFDEVVLGRTEAEPQIVRIGNRGQDVLVIDGARIDGEGADQFRVVAEPSVLAPGQFGEVFVEFEPTSPAQHGATLVVTSNDSERPEVAWPLAGPARDPCAFDAGPDFQNFLLGEIREVTIQASPAYKCVVTGIETDRSLFDILNEPEVPFEIAAGESFTLEIQHVQASVQPGGTPTRELFIRELEGTETTVILAGERPVQGCLSASPLFLRFPRLERDRSSTLSVRVTNDCGEAAAVTSVAMSQGFYYYEVDRDPYPVVLEPLQSITIPVTYTAFSPQGDIGLLSINTNDATNPRFRVELYGEADLPEAEVIPRAVDFGAVVFRNPQGADNRSECSSISQEIRIYSTGAASLRVREIAVDPTGDDVFLVTAALLDGQPVFDLNQEIVIPPESVLSLSVQFFPTRTNPSEHTGRLRIEHNGDEGVTEVDLRGFSVPDGVVTDTFSQLAGPTVDILWVIDDSCSMYDEQARLISNLSRFVGYADAQNADYQMAVTVTDSRSSQAGKFRRCWPHPAILSGSYADAETREEAFECTFLVGTDNISFYESGLGAAMRALERTTDPSIPADQNINAGFLRRDAKLAIVAVSDEDDQSSESANLLYDYYLSVKGFNRPDRVSVHAIAGPVENECAQGPRFAQPGYRYFNMARRTGGRFFDICETDWDPVLTGLGLDVFTPLDEWDLSQAADPSTLMVTVDGVPVPSDPTDGYSYVFASNSIRFNGPALPDPGAQIVAEYSGLCRP